MNSFDATAPTDGLLGLSQRLPPSNLAAEQALLGEAVRRGPVRDFSRVRPTLSEIYREVTA